MNRAGQKSVFLEAASMIQFPDVTHIGKKTLRLFAAAALTIVALAAHAAAQPAGGKTSDTRSTTITKSPPKTPPAKAAPKVTSRSTSGPAASIDGKWWTSGNDFGASEVVFSQSGSTVSGVIHYADGRTGSLNGTMSGKRLQH